MEGKDMSAEYRLDQPTGFACPECGGSMQTQQAGTLLQFRCHIGHLLTAETMLAAQFSMLEAKLAACLASLNERAEVCRQMIEAHRGQGRDPSAIEVARSETLARAQIIKEMLESEWAQTDRDGEKPEESVQH
jgi:two-component system, chemotaxis family, protein-glutamate methylesterase/glutaminase